MARRLAAIASMLSDLFTGNKKGASTNNVEADTASPPVALRAAPAGAGSSMVSAPVPRADRQKTVVGAPLSQLFVVAADLVNYPEWAGTGIQSVQVWLPALTTSRSARSPLLCGLSAPALNNG